MWARALIALSVGRYGRGRVSRFRTDEFQSFQQVLGIGAAPGCWYVALE